MHWLISLKHNVTTVTDLPYGWLVLNEPAHAIMVSYRIDGKRMPKTKYSPEHSHSVDVERD